MRVAAAPRLLSGAPVDARLVGEQRGHRVEHADLHLLATRRLRAREERQGHAVRRRHARDEIGDRRAHLHRWPVGKPRDVHEAALRLHDEVVAGAAAFRARLAKARDRAIDELLVQLAERRVPEPKLLHGAGAEVLENDVAHLHEIGEDLARGRRLEVQRDALLVAVDRHEVGRLAPDERRPAPRVVALARLLDLDHLGAHVGEDHGAERAGEDAREVEDANAGERLNVPHGSFLSTRAW